MAGLIPRDARAVFFDAIGTLIFPEPAASEVYAEVARRAGVELDPREARSRILTAFREEEEADRQANWVTSEDRERARWRRIVGETLLGAPDPNACFEELFAHFAKPGAWRVAPEAPVVFRHLRERGFSLGLASNYDSRLVAVVEGIHALSPLRDRVVVSAAIGYRKPAPEFFREVVRAAECETREVVYVGDDIDNDYAGATAAGLHAVLVDAADGHRDVARRIRSLGELTR
jgi:putative hydrolase of the HAD superfamily